jgi:putative membrane protein
MVFSFPTFFAALAAVIHLNVFIFESFLWTSPMALKSFQMTEAEAKTSRTLAFNQGFYNLFLAIAIVYGLCTHSTLLVNYAMASIAAAGIVLFFSYPKMRISSFMQIGPPAVYFALTLI